MPIALTTRVLLLLACIVLPAGMDARAAPAANQAVELGRARLKESRQALEAGKASEAFALAVEGLEYDAEDLALLDQAARAAEAAERLDDALLYARHALLEARAEGEATEDVTRRQNLVKRLDPLPGADRPRMEERSRRLFQLGQDCVRRKLYANAVEFFQRCYGTPAEPEAAAQLDKLYKKAKVVDVLIDSGIDVPVYHRLSRADRRAARQDHRHEGWKEAWKIKSPNYTVRTNVGWIDGNAMVRAMEQMNRYYREAYLGKRGKGGTARCVIEVYKDRDEFVQFTGNTDALGFFVPGKNLVAAFDPRPDGGTFRDLFETLSHEVSHQFVHMVCRGTVPSWLNEGLATYFESAEIRPNGRVDTNLVNRGRLRNLKQALDDEYPTLDDVVRYFAPGSYPADYYCVGWGLTYFFKNYENEDCERIYRPIFDAYLKTYRKGGSHDSFARFLEHFVEGVDEPGIETFEDLEKRFRTWIEDLHRIEFGGSGSADALIERARKRRDAGQLETAAEAYRWALRKRPDDVAGQLELADLQEKAGEKDAALYRYRRLQEQLHERKGGEPAAALLGERTVASVRNHLTARIVALEPAIPEAEAAIHADFVERVAGAAAKYVELGFPRNALWTLDTALRILPGDPSLEAERTRLAKATKVDIWRWRRIPIAERLRAFHPVGPWEAQDGALVVEAAEGLECLLRDEPPSRYRLEVTLRSDDMHSKSYAGLLFGVPSADVWNVFALVGGKDVELNRILERYPLNKYRTRFEDREGDGIRLAVEVERTKLRLFVDGALVREREIEPDAMAGRLGVVASACTARFTDLRLGL